MSASLDLPSAAHYPRILPVFPLEGAMLLPHGHLPLHIFELRYRNMVEAALASGRMIGMIQPRQTYPQPTPDDAALFEIGCAGRIVSFAETEDGRYLITLRGLCRFRTLHEETPQDGFRRLCVDYSEFANDADSPSDSGIDREHFLAAARAYLEQRNLSCDWSAAQAAPSAALVTTFAMMCPFEPREKQALLECDSVHERSAMLISLFEMAALGGQSTASDIPN